MKNEVFDVFFKYYVGFDNKLQINFAWPNCKIKLVTPERSKLADFQDYTASFF